MNAIDMLAGPVVGSVIGYFTNYLAVKMLFRPYRPVTLFGHTLPFTPGIIPKRRDALARAIGRAVEDRLLNPADIAEMLASDAVAKSVADAVCATLAERVRDKTLYGCAAELIGEEKTETAVETLRARLSDRAAEKIADMHLGDMICNVAGDAVLERTRGTMLAMFVSEDMIRSFMPAISERIESEFVPKGIERVREMLAEEIDNAKEMPVGPLLTQPRMDALKDGVARAYTELIRVNASVFVSGLDVSGRIESRIAEMTMAELENLILSVMKKELNAIVNLGALIGFVIGIINVFV